MSDSSTSTPRFNHLAMSVSPDLLDGDARREILEFYGDVFGWQEMTPMTIDGERLVLMAYEFGQFVFLIARDRPLDAPEKDHFGMSVGSIEELDAMFAKAQDWQARDSRVRVEDREVENFSGVLDLTSFYVGYRLPLKVEVQHFAWVKPGGPSEREAGIAAPAAAAV
jgi:uncharacterized glyoxalase superfamily protein PhnB